MNDQSGNRHRNHQEKNGKPGEKSQDNKYGTYKFCENRQY